VVASVVGAVRTPSNGTDATGASLALTIPAGTAVDDYAVIIVELWDSTATNPTLTYPSGFSQIVNYVSSTDGFQKLKVAVKKLTGADSGTYSVSGFASHFRQGHVVIARGLDLTTVLDVAVNLAQNSTGTALPANAVTTVTAGCLLMRTIANENTCTGTPDTGYTEQLDSNYLKTNTKIQGSAGTDTPAGGSFSASTLKLGALIAFRPAASGGSTVNGVLIASSSLTGTLVGKRTVKATAVGATGLTATVAGRRIVKGAAAADSTLTAAALGAPTVTGTATAGSALTATAGGLRFVTGTAALATGITAVASAVRTVLGSAAAGSSLTAGGTGSHGVQGTAGAGFTLTATATGVRTVHGVAAAGSALLGTISGVVLTAGSGAAQAGSALTATATGARTVLGTTSATSSLAATATGITTGGPVTISGTASAISSLAATMTGSRTIAGQMITAFSLSALVFVPPPSGGEDITGWLTLGDLMDARATHELIMIDQISVRHPGMVEGVFDEDLGYAPSEPKPSYYAGKATVQARQISAGQLIPAGLGTLTQLGYAVHGPVGTTIDQAAPNDVITVTDSADPRYVGLTLIVRNVESSSFVTARRLVCTVYEPSTP
jgi:hypothetical protein